MSLKVFRVFNFDIGIFNYKIRFYTPFNFNLKIFNSFSAFPPQTSALQRQFDIFWNDFIISRVISKRQVHAA